jgi:hypothetical protein
VIVGFRRGTDNSNCSITGDRALAYWPLGTSDITFISLSAISIFGVGGRHHLKCSGQILFEFYFSFPRNCEIKKNKDVYFILGMC